MPLALRQDPLHKSQVADSFTPNPQKKGQRVRTKTYSIGLVLVGVVILFQLAALASVFLLRKAVHIDSNAPLPLLPIRLADSDLAVGNGTTSTDGEGNANEAISHPAAGAGSSLSTRNKKETTILQPDSFNSRLTLKMALDPSERIMALIKEADHFISQGDLDLAREALLEAEPLDPNNVQMLRRQATLAEMSNETHRASVYWQRLFVLGPQIGDSYTLAKQKLMAASNPPASVAPDVKKVDQVFVSGPAQLVRGTDSDLIYEFNLSIPITLINESVAVRPSEVAIKLFFYDLSASGEVLPTRAVRNVSFLSPSPSWSSNKTEVLQAHYKLVRSPEDNRFYGYTFRLYYLGKLQDELASNRKLLAIFPSAPNL